VARLQGVQCVGKVAPDVPGPWVSGRVGVRRTTETRGPALFSVHSVSVGGIVTVTFGDGLGDAGVGLTFGVPLGDGSTDGSTLGSTLGVDEGSTDGSVLGVPDGVVLGSDEGSSVGDGDAQ
jgi:hypothetical protein